MSKKTFYQILGVKKNATPDELRTTYRALARKFHPDLNPNLTPKQKLRQTESMYQINEAYSVLSDPTKRIDYDRSLMLTRKSSEVVNSQTRDTRKQPVKNRSYSEILNEITKGYKVYIPESDWGLFASLIAHWREPKKDGGWKIAKSELDTRDWMPEFIYTVTVENYKVEIFRTIKDWRGVFDREKQIQIFKSNLNKEIAKSIDPNTHINFESLSKPSSNVLKGFRGIPFTYKSSLYAIQHLAYVLGATKENYNIAVELGLINNFGKSSEFNRVGSSFTLIPFDRRELVRPVLLKDIWKRLADAENSIFPAEKVRVTQEGRVQKERG